MSDEDHNRFIAWSFMAHGVMQSLIAVLMVAVFGLFAAIAPPGDDVGRGFFVVIGLVMFLFQAMFAVPAFVAAFALFKKRPWARTASIVAAALAAMNVPVGTLACVYAFWFFLGENWKNVYQQPTDGVSDHQAKDLPGSRWEPYVKNDEGEVVFRSIDPPDWR